jgi:hypothetical protein
MTDKTLLAELRELIGNSSVNETNNRQLLSHLNAALAWFAEVMRHHVVTDEHAIALVEDQRAYPLPNTLSRLLWVEHNSIRLEPTSTFQHEQQGGNWRTVASASPSQYAIEGRELILIPPPDDDAIEDDGYLAMRYIAAPEELGADGSAGLSELDYQIVLYKAAIRWLRSHPSDINRAMVVEYKEELNELVGAAKRRQMNPHETFQPNMAISVTRQGAAR